MSSLTFADHLVFFIVMKSSTHGVNLIYLCLALYRHSSFTGSVSLTVLYKATKDYLRFILGRWLDSNRCTIFQRENCGPKMKTRYLSTLWWRCLHSVISKALEFVQFHVGLLWPCDYQNKALSVSDSWLQKHSSSRFYMGASQDILQSLSCVILEM